MASLAPGLLFLCLTTGAFAQSSVLLDAMSEELNRNFSVLQEKADPAPYFLSYQVTEEDFHAVSATLGALTGNNEGTSRRLDVCVRVGSPKLDNYHRVRGERTQFTAGVPLTFEDRPEAIKQRIWLETDRAYKLAAERFIKIRTNADVKVAEEDASGDFSREEPAVDVQTVPAARFNSEQWAARVRKLSERFNDFPSILTSSINVLYQHETKYFASSEGSRLRHGRGFARVVVSAQAKAQDGTDLASSETFEATDPAGLPRDEAVAEAVARVAKDLKALLVAPEAEPFAGPAIFSGRAAAVFFHEIFGHRVEGHRQKDEAEGQTFTKSVGARVLPDFLSVVFDATRKKAGGVELNGSYAYDDEGIAARPVTVVQNGILKAFLMSRSPIQGFDRSNGHGRRQPGYEVVSRQSNLLVESSHAVSDAALRAMLIDEIKRQNKPYGLYFRDVTGGFTNTQRQGMQAFKVIPIVVYRVYPDRRPDELIRGADIVGTPLASFAKILATGDRPEVFNGYCGAESGNVPVSAVSPALLVSEIEIEKKNKSQDRPPLLPFPAETGGE
ncbi:MAG: metallopeptidase TldD-related protein [Bryobacteraceae bacterium]